MCVCTSIKAYIYTLPSKRSFGQYWHESFIICDNFALIRDNTNYENIFYYINSLYIEKTYILNVIFVNYDLN